MERFLRPGKKAKAKDDKQGWTDVQRKEHELQELKTRFLQSLQFSIWVRGVVVAGLMHFLTIIGVIFVGSIVLDICNFPFAVGSSFINNRTGEKVLVKFTSLMNYNLFGTECAAVFVAALFQTWIVSTTVKMKKFYAENYLAYLKWAVFGESGFLLFGGIGIGIINIYFVQHCMKIFGWDSVTIVEPCGTPEDKDQLCTTWYYWMIMFWTSLFTFYMFLDDYYNARRVLRFPSIQMPNFDRYRIVIVNVLEESWEATQTAFCFIFFTYLIQGLILWLMNLPSVLNPLTIPGTFFNKHFCFYSCIWVFVAILSFKLISGLLSLTLTQIIDVPVTSKHPERGVTEITLADAMHDGNSFIQYLSFYKFYLTTSPGSRDHEEFCSYYELSHPGGHPKTWKGIYYGVLQHITRISQGLDAYAKAYHPMTLEAALRRFPKYQEKMKKSLLAKGQPSDLDNNSAAEKARKNMPHIRPLAYPHLPTESTSKEGIAAPTSSLVRIFLGSPVVLMGTVKRYIQLRMNGLTRPAMEYFRTSFTKRDIGYELMNLLADFPLLCYGINGILELVCESENYDKHGVVQRDLRELLESLVDLYRGVEMSNTVFHVCAGRPITKFRRSEVDAITESVSTLISHAICRINEQFSQHFDLLEIPEEYIEMIEKLIQPANVGVGNLGEDAFEEA